MDRHFVEFVANKTATNSTKTATAGETPAPRFFPELSASLSRKYRLGAISYTIAPPFPGHRDRIFMRLGAPPAHGRLFRKYLESWQGARVYAALSSTSSTFEVPSDSERKGCLKAQRAGST